jgi:ComF family protein
VIDRLFNLTAKILTEFYQSILPGVCITCLGKIERMSGFICRHCTHKIENYGARSLIFRDKPALSQLLYLYPYEPCNNIDLGNAVRKLKYEGYQALASELASIGFKALKKDPFYSLANAVAPIPLHPARFRQRGFNQAELIARGLAEGLGLIYITPLRRIKNTSAQVELTGADRELNIKGAFSLKSGISIKGLTIIMVDDQVTTGATMNSAASALINAGAQRVLGFSITH